MIVDDPLNPAVMNDVNVFVNVRESETVACQLTLLLQGESDSAPYEKYPDVRRVVYLRTRVERQARFLRSSRGSLLGGVRTGMMKWFLFISSWTGQYNCTALKPIS